MRSSTYGSRTVSLAHYGGSRAGQSQSAAAIFSGEDDQVPSVLTLAIPGRSAPMPEKPMQYPPSTGRITPVI